MYLRRPHSSQRVLPLAGVVLLCFCQLLTVSSAKAEELDRPPVPVIATTQRLERDPSCRGHFVEHVLPHTTTTEDGIVRMFQANGAGLALGDLDRDGETDIVLGAEEGSNSILWNGRSLDFERTELGEGPTRAVTIVDVDADGLRDIVMTTNTGALRFWKNVGDRDFVQTPLAGITRPAYAINWSDLDGDGDLDLVAATYDAGFLTDRGNDYLLNGDSGVYLYENVGGSFRGQRLADEAQALALALSDFDGDDVTDILVGNDFGVPDYLFVRKEEAASTGDDNLSLLAGWQLAEIFPATTHSTMSFELGDVDNDGDEELFASDMKPYSDDPDLMEAYAPLMEEMADEPHPEGDPQMMENVLQFQQSGGFDNQAASWNIDGTGWSWSSKFGDLDQDGFLDLYVVNGMIEESIFGHRPNHELVEENQALRNEQRTFLPAPEWQLNSIASGRSMSMADLDADGDLDIVVNNLRSPAMLFENQLCSGQSIQVSLAQPDQPNQDAVGARVGLLTREGMLYREVRVGSGYLSGETPIVHFGFATDVQPDHLEIHWPDGRISIVEEVQPDTLIRLERWP